MVFYSGELVKKEQAMKKIYVGMGLTQAPKEFREDFQKELKDALRVLPDIEILDFIGLAGSTKEEVYTYDKSCTESADLAIFIVNHPSIGLGMEIVYRQQTGKSMLICAHADAKITRMLLGMCSVEDVPFHHYNEVSDIVSLVQKTIQ